MTVVYTPNSPAADKTPSPPEASSSSKKKKKGELAATAPSASASETSPAEVTTKYKYLKAPDEFILIDPKKLFFGDLDNRHKAPPVDEHFQASIAERMLQPIVVTYVEHEGAPVYMIVDGRRRATAAMNLGLKAVQCKVIDGKDSAQVFLDGLMANIQREDVGPLDLAYDFQRLKTEFKMHQQDIAARVHMAPSTISQHLSILELDDQIHKMIAQGKFGTAVATKMRELARIKDKEVQVRIATQAVSAGNWTTERFIQAVNNYRKAEEEKERRREAKEKGEAPEAKPKVRDFSTKDITVVKKSAAVGLVNTAVKKVETLKAKEDADPSKVAYAQGYADAAKQFCGLKALPAALREDAEGATEEE
jgi:ParB/RepB/Spo0J family partition protein